MDAVIQQVMRLDSRFRRETLESLRGALHLILFDTSPLQVHTHANFCMRMYTATSKELVTTRKQAHAIVCACLRPTCVVANAKIEGEGRS